jgi:hypothetical protein
MNRLWLLLCLRSLLLLFVVTASSCQVEAQSDGVASPDRFDPFEAPFVAKVKQIDEFFERFNNDEQTLLRTYLAEHQPGREISREEMIRTLFDAENERWNQQDIEAFIETVTEEKRPVMLDLYDPEWFAEVDCRVRYAEQVEYLTLILQIQREGPYAAKWVIRSVDAGFLEIPASEDPTRALNPLSHGTDFLGLDRAFADARNLRNYLYRDFQPAKLSLLSQLLLDEEVEFMQVEEITYHFLQVDGWVFTLNNFERSGLNSGWLISRLKPADYQTKIQYKNYLLHID